MINLHNVSKWKLLAIGEVLEFHSAGSKTVEVNCEQPTRFDLTDGGENSTFVGVAIGLEKIKVVVREGAELAATSDGEVWYFTNEGDQTGSDRKGVSFTKMMSRRTRSSQLEKMLQLQAMNFERKLAAQEAEAAELQAALGRHDPGTGEVIEDDEIGLGTTDGTTGPDAGAEEAPANGAAAPGVEAPPGGTTVPT